MTDWFIEFIPIALTSSLIIVLGLSLLIEIRDAIDSSKGKKSDFYLPHITIIVRIAEDNAATQACLEAIQSSNYHDYDTVLAANNLNVKGAAALIKHIDATYLYRSRKSYTHSDLVSQAYKRSKKGEVVVVIDSSTSLLPNSLSTITKLNTDIQAGSLFIIDDFRSFAGFSGVTLSISSAASHMYSQAKDVCKPLGKSFNKSKLPYKYVTSAALIKNVTTMDEYETAKRMSLPISVHASQSLTFKFSRNIIRWIAGIVAFSGFTILAITAIDGRGLESFIWSWIVISLGCVCIVLFDTQTTLRQKIDVFICTPFIPIMAIISLVTTVRQKHLHHSLLS